MNKVKIGFCLFLFFLSFIYMSDFLKKIDIFSFLISDNKADYILSTTLSDKFNYGYEKGNDENIDNDDLERKDFSQIEVYFFNTHQTEEYGSNFYNITPTVVTVSEMLKEELLEDKVYSIVEEQSIKKGLDKYGYDYSYSYRISLEYLKEKKEKFPTLKYFFDIHRDSVKGENSRANISGKTYAKVMFLIGKNHEDYKKNEQNIKVMENYLNEHYPGILRDTYYQPLYSYNQEYSSNMFLIEVGGVDNTLEELYNSSVALGDAISYYVGGYYEK